MLSLWQWHFNQARKARESRDVVEIGRKAYQDKDKKRAERFQQKFEKIFGFKPELGEPVVHATMKSYSYWVQGFLFTVDHWSPNGSTLYVQTKSGGWAGFSDPETFYRLVDKDIIGAADG